eukprot:CAMPEP_0118934962 /NCGR_PEP_ID=MMETSP1169-20130426/14604_1 /TAXON_ID=36882 /ORGANISM="Pyramimonas obovata, Strain CCMP722" /LENGTH=345 /DNA_ID=CAMNT_0006877927 /DNA_START=161 /DNA_END=1195 /DNA_ORIENTATION=+
MSRNNEAATTEVPAEAPSNPSPAGDTPKVAEAVVAREVAQAVVAGEASSKPQTGVKRDSSAKKAVKACRVPGCSCTDLSNASRHCLRHRVCAQHLQSLSVMFHGKPHRFCQKCTRFHEIHEFDNMKHSCRAALKQQKNRLQSERWVPQQQESETPQQQEAAQVNHANLPNDVQKHYTDILQALYKPAISGPGGAVMGGLQMLQNPAHPAEDVSKVGEAMPPTAVFLHLLNQLNQQWASSVNPASAVALPPATAVVPPAHPASLPVPAAEAAIHQAANLGLHPALHHLRALQSVVSLGARPAPASLAAVPAPVPTPPIAPPSVMPPAAVPAAARFVSPVPAAPGPA